VAACKGDESKEQGGGAKGGHALSRVAGEILDVECGFLSISRVTRVAKF
jgi:hypothetical protein